MHREKKSRETIWFYEFADWIKKKSGKRHGKVELNCRRTSDGFLYCWFWNFTVRTELLLIWFGTMDQHKPIQTQGRNEIRSILEKHNEATYHTKLWMKWHTYADRIINGACKKKLHRFNARNHFNICIMQFTMIHRMFMRNRACLNRIDSHQNKNDSKCDHRFFHLEMSHGIAMVLTVDW